MQETGRVQGRKATAREFEPATWILGLLGQKLSAAELAQSLNLLRATGRVIGQFLQNYDLLLTPTLAATPSCSRWSRAPTTSLRSPPASART